MSLFLPPAENPEQALNRRVTQSTTQSYAEYDAELRRVRRRVTQSTTQSYAEKYTLRYSAVTSAYLCG